MAYCSKNVLYSVAIWVLMWNERMPWARQERGWTGGITPTRLPAYTYASKSLWRFALDCIEAGNQKAKLVAFRSVSRMSRQNRQCKAWTRVKNTMPVSLSLQRPRRPSTKDGVLPWNSSKGEFRSQVARSASIFESSCGRRLGSIGEATACNCVLLWRLRCRIVSLLQIVDDIWRCCNLPRLSMLRVVLDLAKEYQLLQLSGETKEMMRTKGGR